MINGVILSNYEKIISDQTKIIKGYEKLIKSLPTVSPNILVNGLIVDAQALMKQPKYKPKDEKERRQLFGARIKIRQILNLKQADMAKKLNIIIQSVNRRENFYRVRKNSRVFLLLIFVPFLIPNPPRKNQAFEKESGTVYFRNLEQ